MEALRGRQDLELRVCKGTIWSVGVQPGSVQK